MSDLVGVRIAAYRRLIGLLLHAIRIHIPDFACENTRNGRPRYTNEEAVQRLIETIQEAELLDRHLEEGVKFSNTLQTDLQTQYPFWDQYNRHTEERQDAVKRLSQLGEKP